MNNKFEIGPTNVFEDLGYERPQERVDKSKLIVRLTKLLAKASEHHIPIAPAKLDLVKRGIVSEMTIDDLEDDLRKAEELL